MLLKLLMTAGVCWAAMALLCGEVRAEAKALTDLTGDELKARCANDLEALGVYRDGLRATLKFVAARADLFPPERLDISNQGTAETKPLEIRQALERRQVGDRRVG